jgi:hypothetical protein
MTEQKKPTKDNDKTEPAKPTHDGFLEPKEPERRPVKVVHNQFSRASHHS